MFTVLCALFIYLFICLSFTLNSLAIVKFSNLVQYFTFAFLETIVLNYSLATGAAGLPALKKTDDQTLDALLDNVYINNKKNVASL